jgi:ACS family hexuronate transporter-like MFS transporter
MLFTLLIGQSADAWGYDPLFAALAALDLLAAGVLWSLLRATSRQVRNFQEGNQAC